MPLTIYERLQQTKKEIPRRRDLLHQIGAQYAAETRIHRSRQINPDFPQTIRTDT